MISLDWGNVIRVRRVLLFSDAKTRCIPGLASALLVRRMAALVLPSPPGGGEGRIVSAVRLNQAQTNTLDRVAQGTLNQGSQYSAARDSGHLLGWDSHTLFFLDNSGGAWGVE